MQWAVWCLTFDGWKYQLFEDYDEAREWFRDFRAWLEYDEAYRVEPPVPFVDGRPQEPEYVDRGCEGQISMFDSTFMMELDAELEAAL